LQDFNSVADFPGAHPLMAVSIPWHMPVLSAVGASLLLAVDFHTQLPVADCGDRSVNVGSL
jgi:hypothetical protein